MRFLPGLQDWLWLIYEVCECFANRLKLQLYMHKVIVNFMCFNTGVILYFIFNVEITC